MNITRLLSYTDNQVPKLFKSKLKTKQLTTLLETEWKKTITIQYRKIAKKYVNSIIELKKYVAKNKLETGKSTIEVNAPEDIDTWNPPRDYKLMLTSPPYLQAQEYIRSSKIDLYWLGKKDEEVRKFSKLEIPYRTTKEAIHTPTTKSIRTKLVESKRKNLLKIFDSYFYFTLNNFRKLSEKLQSDGRLCIFVGSATIAGIKVPLWKIISEFFGDNDFSTEEIYEDRIVSRKLFGFRNNLNPNGISSEHLIVLKRS